MQIDHTTRLLLAAIALGLWLNAGVHFIGKAHADDEDARLSCFLKVGVNESSFQAARCSCWQHRLIS